MRRAPLVASLATMVLLATALALPASLTTSVLPVPLVLVSPDLAMMALLAAVHSRLAFLC